MKSYAYQENKLDTAIELFFMVLILALAVTGIFLFAMSNTPAAVPAALCMGVVACFGAGAVWCKAKQYIELGKK